MTTGRQWVAGFRTPLVNPAEQIRFAEPRGFAGETLRQVVHLAGGGSRIRVRLTHRYSDRELGIGAARIAVRKAGDEIVAGTDREVRFEGSARARVRAHGDVVSDPIDLAVDAGTDLVLSLYLPEETGLAAFEQIPMETGWITAGDRTRAAALRTRRRPPRGSS